MKSILIFILDIVYKIAFVSINWWQPQNMFQNS